MELNLATWIAKTWTARYWNSSAAIAYGIAPGGSLAGLSVQSYWNAGYWNMPFDLPWRNTPTTTPSMVSDCSLRSTRMGSKS